MRALMIGALGVAIAARAFAAGTPPAEQDGWLVYQDSHVDQTAPCAKQPILLNGSHTSFTLDGACRYVRIAGEHNDITIHVGAGATIEITGAHNDVSWQQIVPGPAPRLLSNAASNTFHHVTE